MVFPLTPLLQKVEINTGSWIDITSYAQSRDGVSITRGRSDESAQVDAGICRLSLNNRDGRFSPRNPEGAYYGTIGRNTPLRVSVPFPTSYLDDGSETGATSSGAYASTPDNAALDIVGDIDLRAELDLDSWREQTDFIRKYEETGNQRSYYFFLNANGSLGFRWSVLGSDTTQVWSSTITGSTLPAFVPALTGRLTVRVTLDVDNGAAGSTARFYTGTGGVSGSFTQLGGSLTAAGVTSIFNSTAITYVGSRPNSNVVRGKIFGAQILNGIAGSAGGNPNFLTQTAGAASFADAAGRTWTMGGAATISDRDYRFSGEVSAWPSRWDITGTDIYVPIEAAGLLRRLGQGNSSLPSAWRRSTRTATGLVAYWPMEDGDGSTQFASDVVNGKPMIPVGGPDYSSYSGNFHSSESIALLQNALLTAVIPKYAATTACSLNFFIGWPSASTTADNTVVVRLVTQGTLWQTDLVYRTAAGGSYQVICYDNTGTAVYTSGVLGFTVNGSDALISLALEQVGADVTVSLSSYDIFAANAVGFAPLTTLVATTMKAAQIVVVNPAKTITDTAVGHLILLSTNERLTTSSSVRDDVNAFIGETAGRRIERMCIEEGVSFREFGDLDDTKAMGYQTPASLIDILREAADTDGGVLFEDRGLNALSYRPRTVMVHQAATATANYATNQMANLEPVEDDQATRNDITVTRVGGSSARQVKTTGRLSVLAPPNGVGTYDTSLSLSVKDDAALPGQAGWRLALGTIDEARYPVIEFDFTSPSILNDATLSAALSAIDLGQRLLITNPPTWGARESISQIMQGSTEFLNTFERRLSINCSPAVVYDQVGVYSSATSSGAGQSKYSSDGTCVGATMTTTTTAMTLDTSSGPLWTTVAAQMPISVIVEGEVMSITAISSTTNPQFATVVRSVNGVVKTHTAAATTLITLLKPAKYGL